MSADTRNKSAKRRRSKSADFESDAKLGEIGKNKPPVRLPQRSEAVSGDESAGLTPIAAAQKKKPESAKMGKSAKARLTPPGKPKPR